MWFLEVLMCCWRGYMKRYEDSLIQVLTYIIGIFHIWRVLECNRVYRTHIILLWFVHLSILHLAYYPENCIHGSWLSVAHLSGGLPFRSRLGVRAEGASAGELTGLSSLPPIPLSALRPPGKQAQLVIVFYAYFKPIT